LARAARSSSASKWPFPSLNPASNHQASGNTGGWDGIYRREGTDEVEFVVENPPQLRLFLVGIFEKLGPVDGLGVPLWTSHPTEQLVLVNLAHLLRPFRLGRRVVFVFRRRVFGAGVRRVRWQGAP